MLALIKWGGKSLEDEMKQYRHHHYYLPHCSNSLVSYFAARLIFLPISSFSQVVARFQSCSLNLIFLGEVFPRFACTWVVTINPFRHKTERKLKNIFHFLHPNMIKKKSITQDELPEIFEIPFLKLGILITASIGSIWITLSPICFTVYYFPPF